MKKVLIVDDELLVRIGLKSTILWEKNGFEVVGEAKNGREAVELFEKFEPDILLTDIRMPNMNGLELIQELKIRKNSLKAVILTHYDDFNYAKEAIKLGASEYILKTDLSPESLLSVLKKLSDEIDHSIGSDSRKSEQSGIGNVGNTGDADYADDVEILFKHIIAGDYNSKQELGYLFEKCKVYFKRGLFIVAAAKIFINDLNEAIYGLKGEALKKSIENVSNQAFVESQAPRIFCFNDDEIFFLFNVDTQDSRKAAIKIKSQIALLRKNIMQFLDIDLYMGLSNADVSIENIPQLVERARTALDYCFFEPMGISAFSEGIDRHEHECPKIYLDVLRNHIKVFEKSQLNDYINGVFDELLKFNNIAYVREVFIDFLSFAKVISAELNLKNEPVFNEQKLSYSNFDKLHNFEMAKKYIIDIYHELMDKAAGNRSGKYSFVISKCIDYIRNNYHKNISLADAADYVQISKSYLSLLFKQETCINFSSYLTNYRIEKSKRLLLESNYKIYEIAEKVGFDNPYYFSKVFKEVAGVSCKEFKKAACS